jgi:hypothetical protein
MGQQSGKYIIMKTVNWTLRTGFAGCIHTGSFEYEDWMTDDDINDLVQDEVFNRIEMNWNIVENEEISR